MAAFLVILQMPHITSSRTKVIMQLFLILKISKSVEQAVAV